MHEFVSKAVLLSERFSRIRQAVFNVVIPAKAGIQFFSGFWTPAFAGVTQVISSSIVEGLHSKEFKIILSDAHPPWRDTFDLDASDLAHPRLSLD